MNSNIDRQVSEWEDMFLPLSLRQRLQAMSSDVGGAEQVLPLLSDHQQIMDFATYRSAEWISDRVGGIAGACVGSTGNAEADTHVLLCDACAHQSQSRRTELPLAGGGGCGDGVIQRCPGFADVEQLVYLGPH